MSKQMLFDWDQWNEQKNEIKHGVSKLEAESAFFDQNYALFKDIRHSTGSEERFILYGNSSENRVLMIGFTRRGQKIRIITARPSSRKERGLYEQKD